MALLFKLAATHIIYFFILSMSTAMNFSMLYVVLKKCVLTLAVCSSIIALCSAQSPSFTYEHATGLVFPHHKEQLLSDTLEKKALEKNSNLNASIFFKTAFIKKPKIVKHHFKTKGDHKGIIGQEITVTTQDDAKINCTFFNRKSNKLLVVAAGFTNAREYMAPFIRMFDDYDLVLFDFRGHGCHDHNIKNLYSWFTTNTMKLVMDVDSSEVTLGVKEDLDVFAVVDYFGQQKHYEEINGLGICYGAFILAKAQARAEALPDRKKLFNKMILDGCWLCVQKVKEKIQRDPMLIFNPQRGGLSTIWPFYTPCFTTLLELGIVKFLGLPLHRLSLLDYLSAIKCCSILLWYGKDDKLVHRREFEQIWNTLNIEKKAAIITSNPHVINHFKQKELYKFIGDLFYQHNFSDFKSILLHQE